MCFPHLSQQSDIPYSEVYLNSTLYKLANLCWIPEAGLQLTTGNMKCDWHLWYIIREHGEKLPRVAKGLCAVSLDLPFYIKQLIQALFLYAVPLWSMIIFHRIRCYSKSSDYSSPSGNPFGYNGLQSPHKFSSSLKGFPDFVKTPPPY